MHPDCRPRFISGQSPCCQEHEQDMALAHRANAAAKACAKEARLVVMGPEQCRWGIDICIVLARCALPHQHAARILLYKVACLLMFL